MFWYTAQIATTWYQAHIVAVGLTFLAIGVAVGADPGAIGEAATADGSRMSVAERAPGSPSRLRPLTASLAIDPRQFLAGLLFGLACTARLTVIFGAPFFLFVGSGGGWRRRAWSAGLGAALPLLALVVYDIVSTGHVVSPAYDYLYRLETVGYPTLGYHLGWAIEDPRYLLQNLGIGLFGTPIVFPTSLPGQPGRQPDRRLHAARSGPWPVRPRLPTGRAVRYGDERSPDQPGLPAGHPGPRAGSGAAGSSPARPSRSCAIVVVNLMHFSQGWVQFGYRFSNDAAPFALVLVALGFARLAGRRRYGMLSAMLLIVLSLSINLWGVLWSRLLGW